MNMTLSKRGDYVMRAAIFLASAPPGVSRKIREVVADTELPPAFAPQILTDLVRAGLATSKAGRDGGYQLSRDPSSITALEIVEAAEGPLAAERCALGEGPCKWDAVCPLHETWFEATRRVRELLAATTLAELAERDRQITRGEYTPLTSHRRNPHQLALSDTVQIERGASAVVVVLTSLRVDVGTLVTRALRDGRPLAEGEIGAEGALQPLRVAQSDAVGSFQLVWRQHDDSHASHVEADLHVIAVDAHRCQVTVTATWHEERGDDTAAELELRAQTVVRHFLRELASTVEGATVDALGADE
jgi:Rrf2 family protein